MIMVWVVVVSLLACKTPAESPSAKEPVELHFAAINDFHGALYEVPTKEDPSMARGGLPWLAGAVEALRADHPDLILLDGGDLFQGSWPVNATKGRGSIEAFNLLGVDAAALGNHDFDYGPAPDGGHELRGALERAADKADFAWLAANVSPANADAKWLPEAIERYTILEVNGISIGIVGLLTQDTPTTTTPKYVADLVFEDPVQTVEELLPELEAAGVQVLVVLGHLTGQCSPTSYTNPGDPCLPGDELGALLTGLDTGTIDVLIAGHQHTLFAHRHEDTFLLENRSKGHLLGRLDLVVGPDGIDYEKSTLHQPWEILHRAVDPGCSGGEYPLEPLEVGGRMVTPSSEALDLVRRLEEESGSLCEKVGCASKSLGRSRQAESEVGDLVADSMLATFADAEIAIQNSGGLRADIPAGDILRDHLHGVMPFDNKLFLVEMTGAKLDLLFQLGSSGAHGILQVSGAEYHFDPQGTEGTDLDKDGEVAVWERRRLCGVTVNGKPIEPDKTYKVVTTDFLLAGGDHLDLAFGDVKTKTEGPLLRDAIVSYVQTQSACLGSDEKAPSSRIKTGSCPVP